MHHYYYCDRCGLSWRFDSARAMAEFGTRHGRECPVWTVPSFDNGRCDLTDSGDAPTEWTESKSDD